MGFKCPVCKKDFALDKGKWTSHIEAEHRGAGKDILDLIIKIKTTELRDRLSKDDAETEAK